MNFYCAACIGTPVGRIKARTNSSTAVQNNTGCFIVNLTIIEVCESDGWRAICDGSFTKEDAQVACREFGYSDIGKLSSVCGTN